MVGRAADGVLTLTHGHGVVSEGLVSRFAFSLVPLFSLPSQFEFYGVIYVVSNLSTECLGFDCRVWESQLVSAFARAR